MEWINWMWWLVGIAGLAALLWPRRGLLAWLRQQRPGYWRRLGEDALKHLHTCEWRGQAATLESLAGALHLDEQRLLRLVRQMEQHGWLRAAGDGLRLTPEGERLALAIVRAHRLWERYLVDEARMPLASVHAEAERREHGRSPQDLQALDAALGHPALDPHGDPIPDDAGTLARPDSQPITRWPVGLPARIVHLEDEPAALLAQLVAIGLRPGQVVRVLASDARRLVLSDGEATHTLAPIVAANIFVVGDGAAAAPAAALRLSALRPGQTARVLGLDQGLQGFTRRRLLDLGLTPGAPITAELPSLFRDPVAYRVRGALIALRREQADQVLIHPQRLERVEAGRHA
jgi:DtxR family Mn-dependent transcriptional regulator